MFLLNKDKKHAYIFSKTKIQYTKSPASNLVDSLLIYKLD